MTDDPTDDLTRRSRERVDALADSLREEYGEFRTVEKTWRHPPHMYEGLVERFEAGDSGGAGAWVHDEEGRVLLVREGPSGWTDPGGKRESGEDLAETARRAVREATGVEVSVTGVLELHEVTVYDGTDPDRPHLLEPIVTYLARHESGDPAPGEGVEAVEWFEETPRPPAYEEIAERPIPVDPS